MPDTRRRRDSSVELSRVSGVYRIRDYLATVSTSMNKFANSEVKLYRVGGVNAPVNAQSSAVVIHFTISCAVELLRLVTSDDIMTSLLKKLIISIDQNLCIQLTAVESQISSFQIVDRIHQQSS